MFVFGVAELYPLWVDCPIRVYLGVKEANLSFREQGEESVSTHCREQIDWSV